MKPRMFSIIIKYNTRLNHQNLGSSSCDVTKLAPTPNAKELKAYCNYVMKSYRISRKSAELCRY